MNKNKGLVLLAIGAVLFLIANKKNNTAPVAATVPTGTATGDPVATELQPQNVPAAETATITVEDPVF